MTSGGDSFVRMMSKDTDVEVLMPNEDLHTSTNGAKGSAKRSSNYAHKEDIQLCISWQSISSDPIIGNEQLGKAYWQRIAEHYHANRDFESDRNANSLEHRWGNIQKEVSKFQGCYNQIERRHPSGIPHQELHKLRNSPKFQTLESHKRPRSRKSSTPIDRAGEEDEGDDASKSTAPDLSQPSAKKRPIGRKQAKEKLKNGGEDGPYKEAMKDLLDAKEKEAKLKEERWKETW
ncbi:Os12g0264200 [Oryza sativa Japonica Group]|uniref:Os12g0264200 protein n=1 Tax=Oryza sativa subsp. japonica TaxID=39947 RepID=A0A0P0Y8S5_ORYSJ|nr:Os12g0264200 [Oryza sativa Japonica Group]